MYQLYYLNINNENIFTFFRAGLGCGAKTPLNPAVNSYRQNKKSFLTPNMCKEAV